MNINLLKLFKKFNLKKKYNVKKFKLQKIYNVKKYSLGKWKKKNIIKYLMIIYNYNSRCIKQDFIDNLFLYRNFLKRLKQHCSCLLCQCELVPQY